MAGREGEGHTLPEAAAAKLRAGTLINCFSGNWCVQSVCFYSFQMYKRNKTLEGEIEEMGRTLEEQVRQMFLLLLLLILNNIIFFFVRHEPSRRRPRNRRRPRQRQLRRPPLLRPSLPSPRSQAESGLSCSRCRYTASHSAERKICVCYLSLILFLKRAAPDC